nr:MAG TPA: hypothetical protein [Caudoviricetes sp.]
MYSVTSILLWQPPQIPTCVRLPVYRMSARFCIACAQPRHNFFRMVLLLIYYVIRPKN